MILSAQWVLPISSPPIENGGIAVKDDRILDFGPLEKLERTYPTLPVKRFAAAALMPGFVNVHSHLELTVLRGYLEAMDFWTWIRTLTRAKYEILSPSEILLSALLGAMEAIRAGITTVGDPMDFGASLDAVLASGLRGVLYQELFSPKAEEANSTIEALHTKMQRLEKRLLHWPEMSEAVEFLQTPAQRPAPVADPHYRLRLGISPHAIYTVSPPLFQQAAAFARSRGYPMCIHVAESKAEWDFVKFGSGGIAESYRHRGIPWSASGLSPVRFLDQLQVLGSETLLVHCVRLSDDDFELLRNAGSPVAHCPKSNWKLRHGAMNLAGMLRYKIPLGIGSDSVASNNTMDLFEEMRFMLSNPTLSDSLSTPGFSAHDALRMATLGGAQALGLGGKIGSIDVGKQADLIAVDFSKPHCRPVFSPVDTVVYSARADDVRFTMVAGQVLLQDSTLLGLQESKIHRCIDRVRDHLWNARITS